MPFKLSLLELFANNNVSGQECVCVLPAAPPPGAPGCRAGGGPAYPAPAAVPAQGVRTDAKLKQPPTDLEIFY